MKTVSICQPHFMPWIGYFLMIKKSNKFIFLDNVQYNRRSWQNRVHIRSSHNLNQKKFLSLSVKENSRSKKINEIFLMEKNIEEFNNKIFNSYHKTKHFDFFMNFFQKFFKNNISKNLSDFNISLINELCKILEIKLNYEKSSNLNLSSYKKEYLILKILQHEKADIYLSNEGSKNYVDEYYFEKEKIKVLYNEFIHPLYKQLDSDNFLSNLSIIDLLFNCDDPKRFFK
jgi:hypothetical protein